MNTPTPEPVRVDLMLELILSMAVVHGWPREAIETVRELRRQRDDALAARGVHPGACVVARSDLWAVAQMAAGNGFSGYSSAERAALGRVIAALGSGPDGEPEDR